MNPHQDVPVILRIEIGLGNIEHPAQYPLILIVDGYKEVRPLDGQQPVIPLTQFLELGMQNVMICNEFHGLQLFADVYFPSSGRSSIRKSTWLNSLKFHRSYKDNKKRRITTKLSLINWPFGKALVHYSFLTLPKALIPLFQNFSTILAHNTKINRIFTKDRLLHGRRNEFIHFVLRSI